jgi:hypothetical protein
VKRILYDRFLSDQRFEPTIMQNAAVVPAAIVLFLSAATAALAQSPRFDAGVQVVGARVGAFDSSDTGIGARLGWRPGSTFGIESEFNWFPSDFPDRRPFSRARVEGLFGAVGRAPLGRVTPFVKLRPGFVRFQEAPEPFACILIFPAPLSCQLAAGKTLFALEYGGGVEVAASGRFFLRADVADRMLRYPGPAIQGTRPVDHPFYEHNLRVSAGAGVRF